MDLIVFEGLDCCGKSSVIKAISPMLVDCGYKVYNSYEPGNPFGHIAKFGQMGDIKIPAEETVYFWWAARQYEQNKPEYKSADIVVKDRHYDTTYVYLNMEGTTREMYNFDSNFFDKPLLTIFLDVKPEVAVERMKQTRPDAPKDAFETSKLEKLHKRRQKYLDLIEKQKSWRSFSIIDTSDISLDEVIGLSFNLVLRRFEDHSSFSPLVETGELYGTTNK